MTEQRVPHVPARDYPDVRTGLDRRVAERRQSDRRGTDRRHAVERRTRRAQEPAPGR